MPFEVIPLNNNQSDNSGKNPSYNLNSNLEDVISQDSFFSELSKPKEEFEINQDKFNDPPPFIPDDKESPDERKAIRSKAEKSALFIVKQLDNGLAWGASEIALAPDDDNFHADAADLKELASYWADILEESKGNIPPWVMLLISTSLTYGPIYREAFKARAINKELARRAAKAEAENQILKQKQKQKEKQNEKTNNAKDNLNEAN